MDRGQQNTRGQQHFSVDNYLSWQQTWPLAGQEQEQSLGY